MMMKVLETVNLQKEILAMVNPSLNSPRNKANHVRIDLTLSLLSSADRESLPVAVIFFDVCILNQ